MRLRRQCTRGPQEVFTSIKRAAGPNGIAPAVVRRDNCRRMKFISCANSNPTRRQFLKGAAAAVAAPMIVPSSVFGADRTAPPSERITVGFIGCGKMANDYHLPELLRFDDVQAVAVCEVDARRREHAKGRVEQAYSGKQRAGFKGCDTYHDFRELLARKDIDAVC